MKNLLKSNLGLINLIGVFFLLFGCGSTISGTGGTREDFGDKSTSQLRSSVLEIPDNVKLEAAASSGKKSKPIIEDSLAIGIYGAIRVYINFADFLKKNVVDFFAIILDSKILLTAEQDVILPINDGSDLTGIKIEDISKIDNEVYHWKISFYFKNQSKPKTIVRISFENNKAKGQMLSEYDDDPLSINVNGQTTILEKKSLLDLSFDGTKSIQELSINFSQDLSSWMAFAESNWANLTLAQKDSLDISQPSKFSLRVQYNGSEYGISGSSYSQGSHLKDTLSGKDSFLDEDRSTYTFRAKSITGAIDGAKMDVALPVDTLSDVSNIWVNDSFSSVFRDKILNGFNTNLNKLVDNTDDVDEDATDSVDYTGTIIEEQRIGFQTMFYFLDDQLPIASLSDHGLSFSAEEFSNASIFWGPSFVSTFSAFGVNSVDDLNTFMLGSSPDTDKKFIYYHVMAPTVIAYYQANPVALTITELDAIINKSDDGQDNAFRDTFQTLSHLVNPAFFQKDDGLLGTFDGTNFYEYNNATNALVLGVKPTNFNTLNALDLTSLTAIKPNDVYVMTIEIK